MKTETEMGGGQREHSNDADAESSRRTDAAPRDEERLPELARRTIETFVREGRVIEVPHAADDSLLGGRAACFVSIKTDEGDLRGCIGTVEPAKATLAEELIHNAISAATRDPRFCRSLSDPHLCIRLTCSRAGAGCLQN